MSFATNFDAKSFGSAAVSSDGNQFHFGHSETGHHGASSDVVTVPDAHLLFSGTFSRSGVDLVLTGDNSKYVVHDYFKGEKHPTLASPGGATLSPSVIDALTGHTMYADDNGTPAPAQVIGHVMKMSGTATAIRNGVTVQLGIGDAVMKGDVIQTGGDSSMGITFMDGSAFGMTSNARMVLNEMVYDPNGSSNASLISLVQGTITFVAGQTAKNGNMRVETPVATMGIRGTAVLVEIGADNGPTKFSVLVEPDGHTGRYDLYDKSTGALIGTVSQAGQVTFVSALGDHDMSISQKSLADLLNEKAIIQEVFQLYFPDFHPDSNPQSRHGDAGSSTNNLAQLFYNPPPFQNIVTPPTVILVHGSTDVQHDQSSPDIGGYHNTPAQFFTISEIVNEDGVNPVSLEQAWSFKIGDHVKIVDPDIGNAPFFDVATPYVANTVQVTNVSVTGGPVPYSSADLKGLLAQNIDPVTGQVSLKTSGGAEVFDFLGAGQSLTYTLTFQSKSGPDTATQTLTVTVTGTNDAPVIDSFTAAGAIDPTHATASGTLAFHDADLTDAHTISVQFKSGSGPSVSEGDSSVDSATTPLGTFTFTPHENTSDTSDTGSFDWVFTPDSDLKLAPGQVVQQVYSITVSDGHGGFDTRQVTITLSGPPVPNDTAPVVHVTDGVAFEQSLRTGSFGKDFAHGFVSFSDADAGDHLVLTSLGLDANGIIYKSGNQPIDIATSGEQAAINALIASATFTLGTVHPFSNANGGWTDWDFSVGDAKLDFLAAGETLVLPYVVTVNDNNGAITQKTIYVTIVGTNDKPILTNVSTTLHDSDNTFTKLSGHLDGVDPDHGETATLSYSIVGDYNHDGSVIGDYGTLKLNADGTYTYTPNADAINALQNGQYRADTFTIKVTDVHGAYDTATITVNIVGADDKPLLDTSDVSMADSSHNGTHTFKIHDLAGTDPDAGHDVYKLTITSTDGKLSLNGDDDGLWVQSSNNSHTLTLTGSLASINDALQGSHDGLSYSTGSGEHGVEVITATLTDTTFGHSGSDTVHFIFKQGGSGGATMTAHGNDVFFATSGQDTFVFGNPGSSNFGHETIVNFNASQDLIKIGNGAAESLADLLSSNPGISYHYDQDGLLITPNAALHPGDTILLKGITGSV